VTNLLLFEEEEEEEVSRLERKKRMNKIRAKQRRGTPSV